MSRSNPNSNNPNPTTRWLEWNGAKGNLRYYDKAEGKNVEVDLPFQFVLLDRLATVKGWNDATESSIYANEVRSTRDESFTVRSYGSAEPLAKGHYAEIRDKVKSVGGKFTINCYIGYHDGEELKLGSLQFHGAALSAWTEFEKANSSKLYKGAITIKGAIEGKKGSIKFFKPDFELTEIPDEVNAEAEALDKGLQEYLSTSLARNGNGSKPTSVATAESETTAPVEQEVEI